MGGLASETVGSRLTGCSTVSFGSWAIVICSTAGILEIDDEVVVLGGMI
jgi:hypothetical protein